MSYKLDKVNTNVKYKHFKKIISMNNNTGESIDFKKVKEAASYYGVSASSIYQILSKQREYIYSSKGKINFIYE